MGKIFYADITHNGNTESGMIFGMWYTRGVLGVETFRGWSGITLERVIYDGAYGAWVEK